MKKEDISFYQAQHELHLVPAVGWVSITFRKSQPPNSPQTCEKLFFISRDSAEWSIVTIRSF